jgi:hypothetical protein
MHRLPRLFEPTGISNCNLFICSSSSIPGGFHARGRVRERPTKYMASVKEPGHGLLLVPTNGSQGPEFAGLHHSSQQESSKQQNLLYITTPLTPQTNFRADFNHCKNNEKSWWPKLDHLQRVQSHPGNRFGSDVVNDLVSSVRMSGFLRSVAHGFQKVAIL